MQDDRVAQLEFILKTHPEGLRKSEIARRIGVHRSTIGRYIDDLIAQRDDIYEENNLVKIKLTDTNSKQELSVYESLAINMGAEMLLSNSQYQNPHLATGLRKIALNMQSSAPQISSNIMALAEEIELTTLKSNNQMYNNVLEVLIDAWISGRMVKVIHRTEEDDHEEDEIAPYFIGFVEGEQGRKPITLTGRLRHTTEIITIDIATIRDVEVLDETYTIPDNLKPFKVADNVQSVKNVIDTIPLVIKIKEKSALNSFRILAHGEMEIDKQKDGSYICKFEAENSIELVLRIIQGFDNIEILGPEKFREKFVTNLKRILQVYK